MQDSHLIVTSLLSIARWLRSIHSQQVELVEFAFDREFASDVAVQNTSAQRWLSLLRSGDSMPLIRGLM
jgi:hypothetical protein